MVLAEMLLGEVVSGFLVIFSLLVGGFIFVLLRDFLTGIVPIKKNIFTHLDNMFVTMAMLRIVSVRKLFSPWHNEICFIFYLSFTSGYLDSCWPKLKKLYNVTFSFSSNCCVIHHLDFKKKLSLFPQSFVVCSPG